MGQQASAAGQADFQTNAMKSKSFNEDAFRHFKDPQGGWAPNQQAAQAAPPLNYNDHKNVIDQVNHYNNANYNSQITAIESLPSSMMNGVSGVGSAMRGCLYTDVTRPNGSPNERTPPMNIERRPGNRDSFGTVTPFSSHNLTTLDPYSAPPAPAAPAHAEASTMMSTSFLKRAQDGQGPPQGGMVKYQIDTVHEECQVSESYTDCLQDTSAPAREAVQQVQILQERLRCAEEKAAEEQEARSRRCEARYGGGSSVKEEARRNGGGGSSVGVGAGSERQQAHNRNPAVGTATYDEVPPQDAYGMVTSDMPIMAPVYQSQQRTPQKTPSSVASTYDASPGQHRPFAGSPLGRHQSRDFDMCSGYDESHLTSISQQRPQQTPRETPAPSNVGSCVPKALNVADELTERKNWSVGSVLEVFSASASKWYIAQLVEVGDMANSHMITVQFVGDTGGIMQKSMPRSDVQIAAFGRNTRQMPPGFQKVASEYRPGEFSYQDSTSLQKYQTKELAWQNYYAAILLAEQAQELLRGASLRSTPSPEAVAAERLAAQKLMPASLQPAPTMSLAPAPQMAKASDLSSEFYAGAHGQDPVLAHTAAFQPANAATPAHHQMSQQMPRTTSHYSNVASVGPDLRSLSFGQQYSTAAPQQTRPQTVGEVYDSIKAQASSSSLPKSKTPFPGYGQSFAIGTNAGYESYLASQGKSY